MGNNSESAGSHWHALLDGLCSLRSSSLLKHSFFMRSVISVFYVLVSRVAVFIAFSIKDRTELSILTSQGCARCAAMCHAPVSGNVTETGKSCGLEMCCFKSTPKHEMQKKSTEQNKQNSVNHLKLLISQRASLYGPHCADRILGSSTRSFVLLICFITMPRPFFLCGILYRQLLTLQQQAKLLN